MAANKKQEEFKILSARNHIRLRIGMYLGSSSIELKERFVLGKWQSVGYVPALLKMIDEILDNAVDEAIRTKFEYANRIGVSINGETVTVTDNGRGIPQDIIVTPDGKKLTKPEAAWTQVNSGTSFTNERVTIGTNGVGSAATNFLSKSFIGRTWKDGTQIEVSCLDGCDTWKTSTKTKQGNGTEVSFTPDFELFEVKSLHELNTIALVEDRLISLQLAFPEINFSFNKKRIQITDFKKYSQMFSDDESQESVIERSENLSYFFMSSNDGFRTNSFVNGVNTRQGGAYVDYIVNGVVDELVSMIKRKHKIEVGKSTIKSGLTFIQFARNFTNPKFDSQTKERLTNPFSNVRDHYAESGCKDFVAIARKIMAADTIINPIIEAQLAKKLAADKRAATLAQKKLKKVKVAKHIPARSEQATLFVVEGDSAGNNFISVRDPEKAGMFPLRGVIMNTWNLKPSEVLANKELSELIAVLGLDINDPNSVDNMYYSRIATLADADHDGSGHIVPLLLAFFYKYWPRLFNENKICIARTPIMISVKGKQTKWNYTLHEAVDFKNNNPGWKHRYIKGLGLLTEDEYYDIINKPVLDVVHVDENEWFEVMFGADSGPRKEFMML